MSGDLSWMSVMLPLERVRVSIKKLCAIKGAYHLSDDVLSDVLAEACERNDWNPRRASFSTYLIELAKWNLMQRFRDMGNQIEFPADIVDEFTDEPGQLLAPSVPFKDPFLDEYSLPRWYKALWDSLDDLERKALGYMLVCSDKGVKCTYRALGDVLECSHVKAGNVLAEIRRKAEESIAWTQASSAQADDWAVTNIYH
jgi:hypothetical protein